MLFIYFTFPTTTGILKYFFFLVISKYKLQYGSGRFKTVIGAGTGAHLSPTYALR